MKTSAKLSITGVVLILLIAGGLRLADFGYARSRFIQAIHEGNLPVIKECVAADPKLVNRTSPLLRTTALHEAAAYGRNEVVGFLLANGANLDAERDARRTPLHMAVFYGHVDTVALLASSGANINHLAWRHNNSPLHVAVANNHPEVVRLLLNLKADTTIRDMNGDTALDEAGNMGFTNIMGILEEGNSREERKNRETQ